MFFFQWSPSPRQHPLARCWLIRFASPCGSASAWLWEFVMVSRCLVLPSANDIAMSAPIIELFAVVVGLTIHLWSFRNFSTPILAKRYYSRERWVAQRFDILYLPSDLSESASWGDLKHPQGTWAKNYLFFRVYSRLPWGPISEQVDAREDSKMTRLVSAPSMRWFRTNLKSEDEIVASPCLTFLRFSRIASGLILMFISSTLRFGRSANRSAARALKLRILSFHWAD